MDANPFSVATASENSPAVEQSATPPADNGQASVSSDAAKKQTSPEQRAKFRFKWWRSKFIKAGKPDSEASALALQKSGLSVMPEVSPAQSAPAPVAGASTVAVPVVDAGARFKPVVGMLVRAAERGTIGRLVRIARKISPDLAEKVKADAAWDPEAREVLLEVGPSVAARYAAKAGLSPEAAEDISFLGALGMIAAGQWTLLNELEEIASKLLAKQKQNEGHTPPCST